jgi:hypothetical protein
MATVIKVYDWRGRVVRRCDANCHNAKHQHCDCVCGGLNHGVGEYRAEDNTDAFGEDRVTRLLQASDDYGAAWWVEIPRPRQLALPF